MSSEIMVRVNNLSKCYQIYDTPRDRLKQFVLPRLGRVAGRGTRNYFREHWALKDVSFEVSKGETVGILGRNGSGKSTLLQIICGTLQASSGSVETSGVVAALLELGAGFNPEFTGRENVFFNGYLLGVDESAMKARLNEVVEFSGLKEYIDQPVKTYSSGMYARLAFSVAIHVDPSILIVDEALAVGDAGFQLKCMLKMRELQEQGVTILFVSHDTGAVVRLCDRAMVLDGGHLVSKDHDPLKCVKLYERIARQVAMPPAEKTTAPDPGFCSYQDELEGIKETRFGTREAEYLSVQFLREDNSEQKIFKSGDEIQIRAVIRSSRNFEKIVSGFTLKNRAGVDVWGDNTLYARQDLALAQGLSSITYRFRLNVPAGEYFLYAGLADISGERVELDQRWPVRRLTVISERQVVGFVHAPASIELVGIG